VLKKVLIANRGEIAVRSSGRAARWASARWPSTPSSTANALHVRMADEAYALGGETAAESYLNTAAILDAIEQSGADGVHPGYGFYSENTDFARAITDRRRDLHRASPRGDRGDGRQDQLRIAAEKAGVAGVPGAVRTLDLARRGRGLRD
jgi:acetyl-CoA/propionyl-CoA carboxylase biotin carboxyl carrier protein